MLLCCLATQAFIFDWDSLYARLTNHCTKLQKKRLKYKKIKASKKSVKREPTDEKCLLILAIYIRGQGKPLYGQRVPESSCEMKETVDIDILITSMNGNKKIMQSIRIMSRTTSRIRKWNQLSQFR